MEDDLINHCMKPSLRTTFITYTVYLCMIYLYTLCGIFLFGIRINFSVAISSSFSMDALWMIQTDIRLAE